MVTVMRQRYFHGPNGTAESAIKAKGCFGESLKMFVGIRPYKGVSDAISPRSPSMKDLYKRVEAKRSDPARKREARRIRKKLAKMKMPMHGAHKPVNRVRYAGWPSDQIQSLRYRYDGTIKE
jgi:hypothetical protein